MSLLSWFVDEGRLIAERKDVLGGRFRVLENCSSGTFSNVYICRDLETRETVVVKAYRKNKFYTMSGNREIQIMKVLNQLDRHRRLYVRFIGSFKHNGHLCVVLERFGMSLLDALMARKFRTFEKRAVASVILQVAQALNVMHKNGMIHTDIKLENILLPLGFDPELGFSDEKSLDVRLIDFGSLAQTVRWHTYIATTRAYRAPEIMLGVRWGQECDVWSLGCLLIELIFGRIEFDAKDDLEHLFLIQHMIGPLPKWMCEECVNIAVCDCLVGGLINPSVLDRSVRKKVMQRQTLREMLMDDECLVDLVLKMLEPDPFARISLDIVEAHPFFNCCR